MNLVQTYERGASFWDKNPSWTVAGRFKKLWKEDKSKNKKNSSDMMWFLVHCYDRNSPFYNEHEDEKHALIGEDFLDNKNYYQDHEEMLDELIPEFCKHLDSVAEASLRSLEAKLMERDRFIQKTAYTADRYEPLGDSGKSVKIAGTAEMLDKMMERTKKIYKDIAEAMKEFKEMDEQGEGLGGREASLSDKGDL